MAQSTLTAFSDELASLTSTGARSVVQVIGARRPVSGVAHGPDTILTNARALGREDGLRIRLADDGVLDATLAGWDPASGLALLKTAAAHGVPTPSIAAGEPRTGELVIALARSWSNAATASAGIIAVVGGPLRTGRRRQVARVIRVTAPMHEGFAGGALLNAAGELIGIATAAVIRGFAVAIPASIAWEAAGRVASAGTPRRGFVGLALQGVELPASQRQGDRDRALLVMGVTPGSPAETAGIIVGDLLLDFDGQPLKQTDDLLDVLATRAGQTVAARTLRGHSLRDVELTVGSRE